MNVALILRVVLVILGIITTAIIIKDCMAHKDELNPKLFLVNAVIGFITNFFDTWGIGSFAPSTAAFKFTKSCDERLIPGTLNVGDTLPVTVEAVLFMNFVEMDGLTLFLMLASSTIGAIIGAGIVSKWNLNFVRMALGIAMIATAIVTICRTMGLGPFGTAGEALALTGIKLIVGVVCNFFLGALMMVGFGLYSPCIALVALLGMNIGAAFPIMMGSCAFLMNAAVFRFVKEGAYDRTAALMLSLVGGLGAFVAYLLAKYAFSLTVLTYIVCVVMVLTAIMFFRDVAKSKQA